MRQRDRAPHKHVEEINHPELDEDWKKERLREKYRERKVRARKVAYLQSGL